MLQIYMSSATLCFLTYGPQRLHSADKDAVNWLEQTVMKAFTKQN